MESDRRGLGDQFEMLPLIFAIPGNGQMAARYTLGIH